MNEKLYFTDSHMKNFEARVLSCTKADRGYEIILNRSAFFPEGGGQPGDIGRLECCGALINVVDCFEREGDTVHLCESPLPVGERVRGEIDYELRFSRMQNHSGEHIVSGIAHTLFGCSNIGFHMGNEEVTLDFDKVLTGSEVERLELSANEAVWKNVRFISSFHTKEELENINYRSKKEISGTKVRLVTIEGYDVCACCAPHVDFSGEIGIIKILGFMKYKSGVRLRLLCGADALLHYRESMESIKNISVLLSAKYCGVAGAVGELYEELKREKEEKAALRLALAEKIISSLKPQNGNIIIFDNMLDIKSARVVVNAGAELCEGICALFLGNEGKYTFVMASKGVDLKQKALEINAALSAKGGGSSTMITGNAACSRDKITEYFNMQK